MFNITRKQFGELSLRIEHPVSLGSKLLFAARCTKVSHADKPTFCWCSVCSRSICSRTQQTNFGGAAIFTKPVIGSGKNGRNLNRLFAVACLNNRDAGQNCYCLVQFECPQLTADIKNFDASLPANFSTHQVNSISFADSASWVTDQIPIAARHAGHPRIPSFR